jgi:uncharacterized protein (DUF1778 family)
MKQRRVNVTKLRFNDEELAILDKAAEKLGVNRAKFIRESLLECIAAIMGDDLPKDKSNTDT